MSLGTLFDRGAHMGHYFGAGAGACRNADSLSLASRALDRVYAPAYPGRGHYRLVGGDVPGRLARTTSPAQVSRCAAFLRIW